MPKDGQNNTNQEVEKALDYEQVVKSTITFEINGSIFGVANITADKKDKEMTQMLGTELFETINAVGSEDGEGRTLYEHAFIRNPEGYAKVLDHMGTVRNFEKIKNRESFDEYREKVVQGADEIDKYIDRHVVVNDEYGEKAKEFLVTCSSGRMRRCANGGVDIYLQFKHLLGGSNASLYAALNASVADNRLQNNIEKWQHKMPIHQLVIDAGKQLQTMTDYWNEKEKNKGVLPPGREQKYRQELYDQVISMIPLYDKMVSTLEDEQANVDMDADKMFGNQAFHMHPRTARGSAGFYCGLQATKIGLENGWSIEDTARLAAFYNVVYRAENRAICNQALEFDKFEKYDKPNPVCAVMPVGPLEPPL